MPTHTLHKRLGAKGLGIGGYSCSCCAPRSSNANKNGGARRLMRRNGAKRDRAMADLLIHEQIAAE